MPSLMAGGFTCLMADLLDGGGFSGSRRFLAGSARLHLPTHVRVCESMENGSNPNRGRNRLAAKGKWVPRKPIEDWERPYLEKFGVLLHQYRTAAGLTFE